MVIAIGVLAGLLLVLGLGLLVSAINLLPTDLGLVYLQGGITFITGAAIILAIALSTRHRRPRSFRKRPASPAKSMMTDDPTSPPYNLPIAGMAASALGGASFANSVYGAPPAADDDIEQDPRTKAVLEAFERDLGAELAALPAQDWQEDASQKTGEHALAGIMPLENQPDSETASAPDVAPFEQASAEPFMFDLPPLPPLAQQPDWPASSPVIEPQAAPEPAPPAVAGLFQDDDFNFIAQEEPAFAPLETLQEVGSYESAGMRFTMYSDGSVVTLGPDGQRRYRTLEELRAALAAQ